MDPSHRFKSVAQLTRALPDLVADIATNEVAVASGEDAQLWLKEKSPSRSYRYAKDVLRARDAVAWRDLQKNQRTTLEERLTVWREKHEGSRQIDDTVLQSWIDEALSEIASVLAVSLAEAEFPTIKLGGGSSILNNLLAMPRWNGNGLTVLVELPATIVYIAHNLLGAVSVAIDSVESTVAIARTSLPGRNGEAGSLIQQRDLVGWPKSLGGRADVAWRFLLSLSERHSWLNEIFGSDYDYRASIIGYLWRLSFIEFASTVKAKQFDSLLNAGGSVRFDVPPVWFYEDRDLRERGYHLAFPNPGAVQQLASWSGVSVDDLRNHWSDWTKLLSKSAGANRRGFYLGDPDSVPALP